MWSKNLEQITAFTCNPHVYLISETGTNRPVSEITEINVFRPPIIWDIYKYLISLRRLLVFRVMGS